MDAITTAGLDGATTTPTSPRKELIKQISLVLRRTDATEAEHEDALEALVELSAV